MSFRVTIDNNLPTNENNNFGFPDGVVVKTKTLNINTTMSERSVASFILLDRIPVGFHFNQIIGRPVQIWEYIDGPFDNINSWELIFAGQVDEPETSNVNRLIFRNAIVCIDHHAICDRIAVNQSYPKINIDELVKLIIDDYLTEDGIWYDSTSIQSTTKEVQIVCPYVFCTQIFNEVKCEVEALLEISQPYPDGVNMVYQVLYEIQYKPRLFITTWANKSHPLPAEEVDPTTIGIYGLDEAGAYAWYWNKNQKTVYHDGAEAPIAINLYLVIEYIPILEFDIIRTDAAEIANRKLVEGGSGIYTDVMSGSDLYGEILAAEKGDALLQRYTRIAKKISFSSFDNYKTGGVRDVIFPSNNINRLTSEGAGYLVWSVSIRDIGTPKLLRAIELIDGEPVGGWIAFFKKMLSTENYFEIRTDLTISIQIIESEAVDYSEVLNILRIDSLYPAVDL